MSSHKPADKDTQHLSLLDGVRFDPIFIMGSHRSGTTFLYDLLAGTHQFNFLTPYHVLRYGELLDNHLNRREAEAKKELTEVFRQRGIFNRGFDEVPATPDSPIEYGHLINPNKRLGMDDAAGSLTPETLDRFTEMCKKLQFTGDRAKPILLKNPWDYMRRFVYVKEAFPQSKFIFIHRDPLAVLTSSIRMDRSLRDTPNPYLALVSRTYAKSRQSSWRHALGRVLVSDRLGMPRRVATFRLAKGMSNYAEHIGQIPRSDYISIRYEDLCADPDAVIERIMNFLGIGYPCTGFRELVKERGLKPSEEAQRAYKRLGAARIERYLKLCPRTSPEESGATGSGAKGASPR